MSARDDYPVSWSAGDRYCTMTGDQYAAMVNEIDQLRVDLQCVTEQRDRAQARYEAARAS